MGSPRTVNKLGVYSNSLGSNSLRVTGIHVSRQLDAGRGVEATLVDPVSTDAL